MNRMLSVQLKYIFNYSKLMANLKFTNNLRKNSNNKILNINSKELPYIHNCHSINYNLNTHLVGENQLRTYSENIPESKKLLDINNESRGNIKDIFSILGVAFIVIFFLFYYSLMCHMMIWNMWKKILGEK